MAARKVILTLLAWTFTMVPAQAYIDVTPTLGRLINDSSHIVVLRVDKVSLEKKAILFQKVADLKGQSAGEPIRHQLTVGLHPREPALILDLVEPGALAVCFHNDKIAEICIGKYWYECYPGPDGWWIMNCGQAQLSFAYFGSVAKLQQQVQDILAGREVLITAVRYSADDARWRNNKKVIALRAQPRGNQFPIDRFRASLKMPHFIYEMARDPRYAGQPGAAGPEEIPELLKALDDAHWLNRRNACEMLGSIGPPAKKALSSLLKVLHDSHAMVRISAAEALSAVDPGQKESVPLLVQLLHSPDDRVRQAAAEALGSIVLDPAIAVPGLILLLRDANAKIRWAAAESLGRFGVDAVSAVPALMDALEDAEETVRGAAIDALGAMGPQAHSALPILMRRLREENHSLRGTMAAAVFRIDRHQATAVIPAFIQELKDRDTRVRWHGLHYLRKMVHEAKELIPVPLLLDALADPDLGVRGLAATILGEKGPDAHAAVPALIKTSQVNDVWVRNVTAVALVKIMGRKATFAVPLLIEGLHDEEEDMREGSLHALASLGPAAAAAIPVLIRRAKRETSLRPLVAETLWRVSGESRLPVHILLTVFQEKDRDARHRAIKILGQIGPDAEAAVTPLHWLCQEDDPLISAAALESLRLIHRKAWLMASRRKHLDTISLGSRLACWSILAILLALPVVQWYLVEKRRISS